MHRFPYALTYLMWPCKGTVKYGHIRQVVTEHRFNWYEMHSKGKQKVRSHNTSYCLIEVVTKAGQTVCKCIFPYRHYTTTSSFPCIRYKCAPTISTDIIRVWFIVFNDTFNNTSAISWRSVFLVEETGVLVENHPTCHWQTTL